MALVGQDECRCYITAYPDTNLTMISSRVNVASFLCSVLPYLYMLRHNLVDAETVAKLVPD